jgi:hypothetical protein
MTQDDVRKLVKSLNRTERDIFVKVTKILLLAGYSKREAVVLALESFTSALDDMQPKQ